MERRNTIQRDITLQAVRSLGNHATADEIYAYVSQEHPRIGRGTIYRNLNIDVYKRQSAYCSTS